MHDRSLEEIRDSREAYVRMGAHVQPDARHERCRADMVEENERSDGAGSQCRQYPTHHEATDVVLMRLEKRLDCGRHKDVRIACSELQFYWASCGSTQAVSGRYAIRPIVQFGAWGR